MKTSEMMLILTIFSEFGIVTIWKVFGRLEDTIKIGQLKLSATRSVILLSLKQAIKKIFLLAILLTVYES